MIPWLQEGPTVTVVAAGVRATIDTVRGRTGSSDRAMVPA